MPFDPVCDFRLQLPGFDVIYDCVSNCEVVGTEKYHSHSYHHTMIGLPHHQSHDKTHNQNLKFQ